MDRFDIVDTLIQRPVSFTFRRRRYSVYPLTLGKIHLCSRLIEDLGFGDVKTDNDLYVTALRAAKGKREKSLRLIAYVTLAGDDCLDETKVNERIGRLRRMKANNLASVLALILVYDKTDTIMRGFMIDEESKKLSDVLKIKSKSKDKSSVSFGGKSIWGTLIDAACERYGWTYQYVLWGISFSALRLLMEDQVKTVFLSEDERKKVSSRVLEETINADDKLALKDYILQHNWR